MILILIGFATILLIGYLKLRRDIIEHLERLKFLLEYMQKFMALTMGDANGKTGPSHFVWLIKNVNRMQNDLGEDGIVAYAAPFGRYVNQRYQILINTLSEYRVGRAHQNDIAACHDCMLRYNGKLENNLEILNKQQKNPVILFKEGAQVIFSVPVYLLNWFGLINSVEGITSNKKFRTGTAILAIATFIAFVFEALSNLVTVMQGKTELFKLLTDIFQK